MFESIDMRAACARPSDVVPQTPLLESPTAQASFLLRVAVAISRETPAPDQQAKRGGSIA